MPVTLLSRVQHRTWFLSALATMALAAGLFSLTLFYTEESSAVEARYSLRPLIAAGLKDQSGNRIKAADLKDKLVLVNFFFTSCGSACPLQTSTLRDIQQQLDSSVDVLFLSVSIAPLLDNRQAISQYIEKFELPQSRWKFATASVSETEKLISQFGVTLENAVTAKGTTEDQIDHRNTGFLFAKNGTMMQQYQLQPSVSKRLAREITELNGLFTAQ